MARDYYEILGVSRDADKEQIKQAYRRQARKYHPDVNKEPGAEEKFKEINRAYEVLSEAETRERYNRFGEAGVSGAAGFQDMGDAGGFADIFESIFSGFAGGMGGPTQQQRRRGGPVRGDDLRLDLKLEFREAVFGGEKEIRIAHQETCEVCSGTGAKPGTRPRTCSTCSGSGQVRRVTRTPFGSFTQVSTCPTCNGTGSVIEDKCESCDGKGMKQVTKKLKVTIPAGVDNGTRLRISQEGDSGQRGGPAGDLYVYLFVNDDEEFQRDGINILSELKISYLQAILGCRIDVNTVDGPVELTIPPGTQPNTVMKLENRGVPRLGNAVSRGDHLLTVLIDIPTKVTPEERELLEKLAKIKGDRTGKGGLEGFLGNLFKA
ncbi:molecular chaperone DnaJ [Cylindrospermopsis raciborskii]|uniref:Chaperone protein DnaJ n=1 Tax=Cylindrospermopsis raciborskii CENA302 TaxID=1170768 RepID=A0A9Q5W9A8_9CYAN|nr:molecular chaperone DnaJ [Cylindrospermopsis raciborskii]MCZ2202624.1 molecular chaperone DnaJ [Cylindrospermopsis raciborskii PAMP2012]MCZ2204876.1 molecular chaperone DnaJ [Cylindrospermopsis raciborskii PAMP2011]NLQ05018.1 molecular chaperone DnaJ [Cylindrospermopsis raciborskii MVCC19]OHY35187.1 molecular chaperone DnaJ [Cylindrospermopsis raciborskii MVCC14]OPH09671.1 molecular chaperone DnaJ [Cylindrospermopsis raciborskii CENA302]